MTQTEILDRIASRCCSNGFLEISKPITFGNEGPFLFALTSWDEKFYIFCFEISDSTRFLADPTATPKAYGDPAFFEQVEEHMNLAPLHGTNQYHSMILHKVLLDEPACRQAVQNLWQTHPKEAARILMLSPDGIWYTGQDIRSMPVLLS